jgi:hypothetical protein
MPMSTHGRARGEKEEPSRPRREVGSLITRNIHTHPRDQMHAEASLLYYIISYYILIILLRILRSISISSSISSSISIILLRGHVRSI